VKRIRRFVAEAISELRKVSWPTFAQTRNLTVLVFAVSVAIGLFVTFWDQVFQGVIGLIGNALS
jgi:preprotein translocase SecE subunit